MVILVDLREHRSVEVMDLTDTIRDTPES